MVTRYLGCPEENRAELAVAEMLKLLDKWEGKIAVRTVVILLQFGDPVHCCKCCGCRKMTKVGYAKIAVVPIHLKNIKHAIRSHEELKTGRNDSGNP